MVFASQMIQTDYGFFDSGLSPSAQNDRKTGKANSISVVLSKRSESKDPHPRDFPKRLRILRCPFDYAQGCSE